MRAWATLLLAGCAGCASSGGKEQVLYDLSSPDVGVPWHLHARDGALICKLPCTAWLGADSGAWIGVHDPKRSWRLDVPSELPAAPGSRVYATARVGKGAPALAPVGYVAGITGATAAVAGVILVLAAFAYSAEGCLVGQTTCSNSEQATTFGEIGAPALAGGAVLGVVGVTLLGQNRAPTLHVRLTPSGVAGTF
jgi:hypothetical protein